MHVYLYTSAVLSTKRRLANKLCIGYEMRTWYKKSRQTPPVIAQVFNMRGKSREKLLKSGLQDVKWKTVCKILRTLIFSSQIRFSQTINSTCLLQCLLEYLNAYITMMKNTLRNIISSKAYRLLVQFYCLPDNDKRDWEYMLNCKLVFSCSHRKHFF